MPALCKACHATHACMHALLLCMCLFSLYLRFGVLALPRNAAAAAATTTVVAACPRPHHVRIQDLHVDTHADLVIDTHSPHFSWQLEHEPARDGGVRQLAYQLRVHQLTRADAATTITPLIIWDTDVVASPSSSYVHYTGPALSPDTRYSWSLQYWSSTGAASCVARGTFRTALLERASNWTGEWIGSTLINMNELRTDFTLDASKTIEQATVFMAGIGYSSLLVNGVDVDPSRRLDPGWTTYQRRVLYTSHDLTALVHTGVNGVGVRLGNGWYNQQMYSTGLSGIPQPTYGPPRLLFQLNVLYADGSSQIIPSSTAWTGREGAHTTDNVYMGSSFDRRRWRNFSAPGFTDLVPWLNASILPSPLDADGVLSLQPMDPIRIGPDALEIATSAARTGHTALPPGVQGASLLNGGVLKPVQQYSAGVQVFDFGQNFAGWCQLNVTGPAGYIAEMRFGEFKYSEAQNGLAFDQPSQDNLFWISATDTYVYGGESPYETFEPLFTYHGFRYMSLYGPPGIDSSNVQCFFAHSATRLIGNFTTDSVVLNQIQHNLQWSQLSNSYGLPTDCPNRNERRGWMGDAALSVDAALYNFDLSNFYLNFLTLMADVQQANGALYDTVPHTCCTSAVDPNWGTAAVHIAWTHYQHYGNARVLATYYPLVTGWVAYMTGLYNASGLHALYYRWGDWVAPHGQTNGSLVSSFAFLRDVYEVAQMATVLNATGDAQKYNALYAQLAKEFYTVFYEEEVKGFADNSQAANTLALALPNVVPNGTIASVVANLVDAIVDAGYRHSCGIVSIAQLFPVLSEHNQHDVALRVATGTEYPSYGYMFTNTVRNATTLWESWSGGLYDSLNHHMFGSIGAWFYRYVVGIELRSFVDDEVLIYPRMHRNASLLREARGEVHTVRGMVEVEWRRRSGGTGNDDDSGVELNCVVPPNLGARVQLAIPADRSPRAVWLQDEIVWKAGAGITNVDVRRHAGVVEMWWQPKGSDGRGGSDEDDTHAPTPPSMFVARVSAGTFQWVVEW